MGYIYVIRFLVNIKVVIILIGMYEDLNKKIINRLDIIIKF